MDSLDKAVTGYYLYLRDLRRRATSTTTDAARLTTAFVTWMATEYPDVRYTQELVSEHFTRHAESQYKDVADTTYNHYVGTLRRWTRWLAEEGMLGADQAPGRNLLPRENPRRSRKKEFIREDLAHALAQAAEWWHPRDKYYILLSYYLGRRWSEVSRMRVRDIDFNPRRNMPNGVFVFDNIKSRRPDRALPLREAAAQIIREWFEVYAKEIGRPLQGDDFLIPAIGRARGRSVRGVRLPLEIKPKEPIPYPSALAALKRAAERAGVDERTTHGLRRGMLDDLTQETGHIRVAKVYADHSSERITEEYTDNRREVQDLGALFEQLDNGPRETPVQRSEPDSVVISLAERLAQRRRTS